MTTSASQNCKNWKENVDLKSLITEHSWDTIFNELIKDERFAKLESYLTKCILRNVNIFPPPDLVFNAFNLLPLNKVRVVIVGQDCYPKTENNIPQAMGLSFSVPFGLKKPSSLINIYKNLEKYKHITNIPEHGNLEHLVKQGVLLINSALTVQENIPNSHQKYWEWFTDEIIKFIASYNKSVRFVLWGRNAIDKLKYIGECKYIASSHPSGLSCSKPCGKYPSFDCCDFAKDLNINWQI